jgi:APA family basic amino acid/polyamine antiporter
VFAIYFGGIGTLIIADDYDFDFACLHNGLIMAGARVYYTMAKDGVFFAAVNKASVPSWALWAQCFCFGFVSDREIW